VTINFRGTHALTTGTLLIIFADEWLPCVAKPAALQRQVFGEIDLLIFDERGL
jgi:hypothetical protein